MRQKGVYPYDCMDIFEKFNDPKLLTKKDFYSMLTNTGITDEQYQHAQKVWSTFRLQNMGQYHDLYLKSGVLLLADVFENFRKTGLDVLVPTYKQSERQKICCCVKNTGQSIHLPLWQKIQKPAIRRWIAARHNCPRARRVFLLFQSSY